MEIHRLERGDEPQAVEVLSRLTTEEDLDYAGFDRGALGRFLDGRDNVWIAARVEGRPAAFLIAYLLDAPARPGRWAYFYDILVQPELRGRGIATAMVEELLRVCRDAGVERIWVGTGLDNTAARALFVSTGADEVSETYVELVYRL